MRFSIYIRGRGWVFQLAKSLNKNANLKLLVTSYPKFFTRKFDIPNNKVRSIFILELLIRSLKKINPYLNKININLRFHIITDWLADIIFSWFYIREADFFLLGFGGTFNRLIAKSKKKNIKTIYFINNSSPDFREKLRSEYEKLGLLKIFKKEDVVLTQKINKSIHDADYVGCLSTFQRDTYINQGILNKDKALTVIMSVDTSVFFPKKIHNDKFIVLTVGNDFVRKGFKYLIDGFNSLKLPNSELWVITNFDDKIISNIVKLEKNNLIINSVKEFDLPKFYNQSSVFCLPTLEEGSPIVLTQAMACGLPIIATKNCQAPDVINNGLNGFVIEDKSSTSVAEKIKYFYDNPEQTIKMGENAAKYAEKNLSFDAMSENIIKFCKDTKNK